MLIKRYVCIRQILRRQININLSAPLNDEWLTVHILLINYFHLYSSSTLQFKTKKKKYVKDIKETCEYLSNF